jgi:hypothetical protein
MVTLSAGAESIGSGPNRVSVKVVAGTYNHRRFTISVAI